MRLRVSSNRQKITFLKNNPHWATSVQTLNFGFGLLIIFISFRNCTPGYLIEEFFHHDIELRVATIFGKVIVGASDCGLRIVSTKTGPEWAK